VGEKGRELGERERGRGEKKTRRWKDLLCSQISRINFMKMDYY
jgi:hypothetical protein